MLLNDNSVLCDHQIGHLLIDSIKNAKREIIIVSPRIRLWGQLEEALGGAKGNKVKSTLYYRAGEGQCHILRGYESIFDVMIPIENLHPCLFFIDDEIIITSTDLCDLSNTCEREIAIRILDQEQKEEIRAYLKDYLELAEPLAQRKEHGTISRIASLIKSAIEKAKQAKTGFCVLCGVKMEFDKDCPICTPCYKQWSDDGHPDHVEKYCHKCGEELRITIGKPKCISCGKRHREPV